MRKLKPISRILFERQSRIENGERRECFNLAEILAALSLCAILAAAVIVTVAAVAAMEATR